jgi:hypothetical protein
LNRSAATVCLLLALPCAAQGLHRFAIVAGNDEGGAGTRPLFYARDDARRIAGILERLGGVQHQDMTVLLNGSADDLLAAIGQLEQRITDASKQGDHTALFVYYSGHAKDGALRLGNTSLPFSTLKARLAQAPADIRIGIFDACQSGLMTRTKGARRAPEFAIETDAARDAKGLVILTSSASDEDSQESDQIGASYFSHHLASGLLGDADRSGDGRVTLSEAYAYAYERTVADTADSAAGAQHPTFSYDLAGNGDLVLTDVASHREGILFPSIAPDGTYYVIDGKGSVAAEIVKVADKEKRIALAPGVYRIKRRLLDRLRIGEVSVVGGQVALFDESRLHDAPFSDDPVKGVDRTLMLSNRLSLGVGFSYQAFFDAPTREDLFPPAPLVSVELELHNFWHRDVIWAFDGAFGASRASLTVNELSNLPPLPFSFSELDFGTSIIKEWSGSRWVPFIGARAAVVFMIRKFDPLADSVLPQQFFATVTPGLLAGIKYRVNRSLSATLRARVQYLYDNVDPPGQSLPYAEIAFAMSYEL